MQKIGTQAEWVARAAEVLPGGGIGNFDPSGVIRAGRMRMSGMKMAPVISTI